MIINKGVITMKFTNEVVNYCYPFCGDEAWSNIFALSTLIALMEINKIQLKNTDVFSRTMVSPVEPKV